MGRQPVTSRADASGSDTASGSRHRRRSRSRSASRSRLIRPLLFISGALVLLLCIWAGLRAYTGYRAYQGARASLQVLEKSAQLDPLTLSVGDVASVEADLRELKLQLSRLESASAIPLGGERLAEQIPWLGPRYAASRDLLRLGVLLSGAGTSGVSVLREVLVSFEATGVSSEIAPAGPTWLDALTRRQATLQTVARQIAEARALRANLDESNLPDLARSRLGQLDQVLDRADIDLDDLLRDELALVRRALGGDGPARYLVLFQNPAELRPSGGFPGTAAIVTLDRGQLRGQDFSDIQRLNDAYVFSQHTPVPQPYAIALHAPERELAIFDATWWPDFARSGAQVKAMYDASGWPAIDGVVAVDPAIVRDLLRLTGPIAVEFDGSLRQVSADNLLLEIERERQARPGEFSHKELVGVIGLEILSRLKVADRATLKEAAEIVRAAADRRDIQVYHQEPDIQANLDARRWTGRDKPMAGVPTLSTTFANMAFGKSSLRMFPSYELHASAPVDNHRQVTLRVRLQNTGSEREDPFYAGFQRWWINLDLPDGSVVRQTSLRPLADPEAPDGGSYLMELSPGKTDELVVTFDMPDSAQLLIRRQPGLNPGQVTVTAGDTCPSPFSARLNQDLKLDFSQLCR